MAPTVCKVSVLLCLIAWQQCGAERIERSDAAARAAKAKTADVMTGQKGPTMTLQQRRGLANLGNLKPIDTKGVDKSAEACLDQQLYRIYDWTEPQVAAVVDCFSDVFGPRCVIGGSYAGWRYCLLNGVKNQECDLIKPKDLDAYVEPTEYWKHAGAELGADSVMSDLVAKHPSFKDCLEGAFGTITKTWTDDTRIANNDDGKVGPQVELCVSFEGRVGTLDGGELRIHLDMKKWLTGKVKNMSAFPYSTASEEMPIMPSETLCEMECWFREEESRYKKYVCPNGRCPNTAPADED